jgi:hypothetical protein
LFIVIAAAAVALGTVYGLCGPYVPPLIHATPQSGAAAPAASSAPEILQGALVAVARQQMSIPMSIAVQRLPVAMVALAFLLLSRARLDEPLRFGLMLALFTGASSTQVWIMACDVSVRRLLEANQRLYTVTASPLDALPYRPRSRRPPRCRSQK